MSIESLLDSIEEVLENSKNVPFSSKISVDGEQIITLIEDIRLNMPDELMKARKIASERKEIIDAAQGLPMKLSRRLISRLRILFPNTKLPSLPSRTRRIFCSRQKPKPPKLSSRQGLPLPRLRSKLRNGQTSLERARANTLKISSQNPTKLSLRPLTR